MSTFPSCTLVAPTYNWPEALELLLLSILNQTYKPNEIIIADDGSTVATKKLIEKYRDKFSVPLLHVWHEDIANRKPAIMNQAIAQASCDYIIEIDGDIIMHENFIYDHLTFAKRGQYLFGSRVNIKKNIVDKVLNNKQISFSFLTKGVKNRTRTFYFPPFMQFIGIHKKRSKKLRGCNMSFWRTDFIKVNGFNEDLVGWGHDDSELIQRFHNIGIVGQRLKFAGIAYHIYHPVQKRDSVNVNIEIEKQTTEQKLTYIENGVKKYL